MVLIQVKSAAKRTVLGLKNKREKTFLPFKAQLFHIQVVRYAASVRIERICEFCGKTFIAKTCKTRFCCKACNDKYYKELIRNDRYNAVTKEVKEEKKKRIRLAVDELEVIQAREFISLKQLAIYLGVSRKSIYTYMRIYEIPFYKLVVELLLNAKRLKRL